MDLDARDAGPMDSRPFLEMLISGDIAVDGGQSVSETGALLLPSADHGSVLTKTGDNVDRGRPSAEPNEPPTLQPLRRLRHKTTLLNKGSAGDGSRSVTPPTRRSRDGSGSAVSPSLGLSPEADEKVLGPSRRRFGGGSAVAVVPVSVVIQRPGVARELCEVEMSAGYAFGRARALYKCRGELV